MKAIITATAPTAYQINSVHAFKMPVKANGNGSYTASMEFETEEEAKKYLNDLAFEYYEGDEALIDRNSGSSSLTLDAVTAHIELVTKFIIQDQTNTSQANYIDENGNPTHQHSAKVFDTYHEAVFFAKDCDGNGDWYFIEEV